MMNRRLLVACLGLVAALGANFAQAGHHGHGGGWSVNLFYGGGGWGPYYRPWPYYYYPPYAYAPPPVVYTTPTVVAVPSLTAVQTPPITVPAAGPTVNVSAPPTVAATTRSNTAPRTAGVTIRNPINSGTPIAFVVDSRTEAELAPGETMPLVEKNSYFIEFDRGGDFGTAKKTIGEGTYEFVATDKGWDLQPADAVATPTPVVRRNTLPTSK